jgi:hypothetical protein
MRDPGLVLGVDQLFALRRTPSGWRTRCVTAARWLRSRAKIADFLDPPAGLALAAARSAAATVYSGVRPGARRFASGFA